MTTPDELEQRSSAQGDLPRAADVELPLEAGEADVLEQAAETAPVQHRAERDLPLEAPEADAVEQALVVDLDEDERRE